MLSIIFTYGCICHTSCYWCGQIRSYCWYSIGSPSYRETVLSVLRNTFLCKTILQVSSPGHSGGGAGKLLLELLLWNLNSTSNSPVAPRQISCQISANQRKAEMSWSVKKHWKTHTKGNDIITNVISTNQHFSLLFRCRYSNSRDVVASSPSFSRSAARAPQRACHRLMEYPPLSYLA